MAGFVFERLCSFVAVFLAVTLFVFLCFFVLPSPGGRAIFVRDSYWQHGSMPHQYVRYVWRLVRYGDLGHSYVDRQPVTVRLRRAAPSTLSLVAGGLVVGLLISILLGLLAACRPRSLRERASTGFVLIRVSLPSSGLCLALVYLFAYRWPILPRGG